MKIAIPRLGETVAPCFEFTATIVVFTMDGTELCERREFNLQSKLALDRARLLRDQGVEVLICGGVSDRFEDIVKANGVEVVSWVSGRVDDLLEQYVRGTLTAGSARLCDPAFPHLEDGREAVDA